MNIRIGTGFDVHALVEGRPLILGGCEIPFEKGLKGHSDGDALLHAIADALLGACAMGDIGRHFPDTDPKYKDADSAKLLGEVGNMIKEQGFKPANVDANVIAQRPKLAEHIESMRRRISDILAIPIGDVSVKARTAEGMGEIGEGRAIAVHAAVLVEARS
jgi:2-C-methyl-D-erythritol 2,4-cyclodiphosphate synthase